MSNPEKAKMDADEEINENSDGSYYMWSDEEEGEIRELVLALPALTVSERLNADELIRNEAIVAAQLLLLAAQEAPATTEQGVEASAENVQKPKLGRPREVNLGGAVAAAGASGPTALGSAVEEEPAKKLKKKCSSKLHYPPPGPPRCNICGRNFVSWKVVFGHLRAHKDRGYHGFLPPPVFNAAEEARLAAVNASSSGWGLGSGTCGLDIDLNVDPAEEEEEETEPEATPKFDLNRSPPHEEEEEKEDEAK
ncbi:unnamed protein product [Thlaspi arvense]|uniref:C2H2-type domain-containing protein n=1 Tax=Thlaspi arvense TaxID=13288 RepID=A0AAU9T2Z2_THLAR|nr:unnamed protein product [Thlaspi arvense]